MGIELAHSQTGLIVPPGERSVRLQCTWDEDYTIMSLWGHMHEWGASISVDQSHDGLWERIYEETAWDPAWTNDPQPQRYEPGEYTVPAGDTFVVTCNWNNTTTGDLSFPSEMCAALGVGYSSKEPINCLVDVGTAQ